MPDLDIRRITQRVLCSEAARGQTTLQGAAALCMRAAERGPGVLSRAMQYAALRHLFRTEVTRQLKQHLPPGVGIRVLPRVPPEILRRLPQWFSTGEGVGAIWVPSPIATREQIMASRNLRAKKADQTVQAVERLDDLLQFMIANGINSLDEF